MKISMRWDDEPQERSGYRAQRLELNIEASTFDDLVRAQSVINGLLNFMPTEKVASQ